MTDFVKKILIAEDEKPLLHALTLKLQHEGFIVEPTTDGKECIALLQKDDYDVILLDLIMPNVDGFQVMEYLQKHSKNIHILVLSNLSQDEDVQRAFQLGAEKFYVKANTALSAIVTDIKALL